MTAGRASRAWLPSPHPEDDGPRDPLHGGRAIPSDPGSIARPPCQGMSRGDWWTDRCRFRMRRGRPDGPVRRRCPERDPSPSSLPGRRGGAGERVPVRFGISPRSGAVWRRWPWATGAGSRGSWSALLRATSRSTVECRRSGVGGGARRRRQAAAIAHRRHPGASGPPGSRSRRPGRRRKPVRLRRRVSLVRPGLRPVPRRRGGA